MTTQFFANPDGSIIGADYTLEELTPVPPPKHGLDKWDFKTNSYIEYKEALPVEDQIKVLYEALPIDLQEKYEQEILFGAEWLKRGNLKMVSKKLASASKKLNKDNPVEVKLFQDISKLLGVV